MAGRKDNLKALFTNTRTRVIIVFTFLLLVIAVVIGYLRMSSSTDLAESSANLPNTPSIQSIPGALNPTEQYAKLQEAQNVNQAKNALQTGGSAIPTLIRSQEIGDNVQVIGNQDGQTGGVGFATLNQEQEEGTQRNEWIQQLQNASCSQNAIQKVIGEGAQMSDVRKGCSCIQMKANGYSVSVLLPVCSCPDLKAAGFNVRELKDGGLSANQLRTCGFDACELRNAGFGAQAMKDGGFSDGELKGAGFPDEEIARASGIPDSLNLGDILKAQCNAADLQRLRAAGVSASAIRHINGCNAAQLRLAGFTPADMNNAGLSAADLKQAGFSAPDLRNGKYSARDLINAGYLPDDLPSVGYSAAEIAAGDSELPPDVTADAVKNAGCDVGVLATERAAGVSAKNIRQFANCPLTALKDAGFGANELADAGFSPQDISSSPTTDDAIKAAGCDINKLHALVVAGVDAQRVRTLNNCSLQAMKAAGFSAKNLLGSGASPQDVLAAGYSPDEIKAAAATLDSAIRAADCDPAKLKTLFAAGVTAKKIRELNGCSLNALKDAGYDAKALSAAGFTPQQLLAAGLTPSAASVIAAGRKGDCNIPDLTAAHTAGVTATAIKETMGCSADALKAAGYMPDDLRAAGFTAADLKNSGFNPSQLKTAGFSPGELRSAGFTASPLRDAGFTAAQLKDAGFGASDLRAAGFTPAQLQAAGFSDEVAGLQPVQQSVAPSTVNPIPSYTPPVTAQPANSASNNAKQLQSILDRQNQRMADQRVQQQIQQRTSAMLAEANQSIQQWQKVSTQVYVATTVPQTTTTGVTTAQTTTTTSSTVQSVNETTIINNNQDQPALIKTGDVLFAVIDTSVNSDEPGPILATIVSGRLKGSKLIGSFNLPNNADKIVISFNTLSIPGAAKTVSINAYAIDPNTARTAISSRTDHHYLLRYGSLFASSFLEGIGNAFQSADTTVTIGGTGGGDNITVQNGINRSVLENAVIAMSSVGQAWGQAAQQQFNTPTTVQVYSGTAVGILFTQDLTL